MTTNLNRVKLIKEFLLCNPLDIDILEDDIDELTYTILSEKYIEPLSIDWFDRRLDGLSATDVAAVLNHQKKYQGDIFEPLETVFLSKTNQIPRNIPKEQGKEAMQHGNEKEPFAGEKYSLITGQPIFKVGLLQHKENPIYICTPDILRPNGKFGEIKSPRYRKIYPLKSPEDMMRYMPHYYDQVMYQTSIGMSFVDKSKLDKYTPWSSDFIQYGVAPNPHYLEGNEFTITEIPYDSLWLPKHSSELMNFWDKVLRYREAHPEWKDKKWDNMDPAYIVTNLVDAVDYSLIKGLYLKPSIVTTKRTTYSKPATTSNKTNQPSPKIPAVKKIKKKLNF